MFRVFSPKSRKKKKKDGADDESRGKKKMAKGAGDDGRLMLKVKIIEGRNLRAADRNKSSDPFVLVSLGREKFKTSTVKKSLNPKWTAKNAFIFGKKKTRPLKDDSGEVVFNVKDADTFMSDFLGTAKVAL